MLWAGREKGKEMLQIYFPNFTWLRLILKLFWALHKQRRKKEPNPILNICNGKFTKSPWMEEISEEFPWDSFSQLLPPAACFLCSLHCSQKWACLTLKCWGYARLDAEPCLGFPGNIWRKWRRLRMALNGLACNSVIYKNYIKPGASSRGWALWHGSSHSGWCQLSIHYGPLRTPSTSHALTLFILLFLWC